MTEQTWNDCLVQIDYPARQTVAVALGDRYAAVAFANGAVIIYHHDSAHPKSDHAHGERVKTLAFSINDQYLASSGLKMVKVWDITSGTLFWNFNTTRQVLALHFMSDFMLVAAAQDNRAIVWNLQEGTQTRQRYWTDSILAVSGQRKP